MLQRIKTILQYLIRFIRWDVILLQSQVKSYRNTIFVVFSITEYNLEFSNLVNLKLVLVYINNVSHIIIRSLNPIFLISCCRLHRFLLLLIQRNFSGSEKNILIY